MFMALRCPEYFPLFIVTFASLSIMKPYSFVMVDAEKETLAELLIVDEEETMFLSGELLQGLDDELNAFLKDLLEI